MSNFSEQLTRDALARLEGSEDARFSEQKAMASISALSSTNKWLKSCAPAKVLVAS
jgi:hypothetical protein